MTFYYDDFDYNYEVEDNDVFNALVDYVCDYEVNVDRKTVAILMNSDLFEGIVDTLLDDDDIYAEIKEHFLNDAYSEYQENKYYSEHPYDYNGVSINDFR